MRGVLRFKGALRFDGNFQGEIETSDTLIIGNTGTIHAKIDTGSLFNMGQIVGNVKAARKVSIFSNSNLTGNIDTPVFVAEEGAIFKGSCMMPSTPPKKSSSKDISVKSGALAKDYQTYLPKTEGI
ncbi:MAG: polymer-forming cytoskeletal protein, partial [Candidatus Desulfatibia sp.]|uniref:polymer-forming cytoskeletal protein n=1 Tax=Candidatus Desulfatibia sp. TaxID=3101189 RepID=UPI002F3014A8